MNPQAADSSVFSRPTASSSRGPSFDGIAPSVSDADSRLLAEGLRQHHKQRQQQWQPRDAAPSCALNVTPPQGNYGQTSARCPGEHVPATDAGSIPMLGVEDAISFMRAPVDSYVTSIPDAHVAKALGIRSPPAPPPPLSSMTHRNPMHADQRREMGTAAVPPRTGRPHGHVPPPKSLERAQQGPHPPRVKEEDLPDGVDSIMSAVRESTRRTEELLSREGPKTIQQAAGHAKKAGEHVKEAGADAAGHAKEAAHHVKEAGADAAGHAKKAAHHVKEAGADAAGRVKEAGAEAAGQAKKVAHNVKEAGAEAVESAKEVGAEAAGRAKEAGAEAVGRAKEAGAEAAGQAKKVAHNVKEAGAEAVESAKEAAGDAGERVSDAAKRVAGRVVDDAKQVAGRVKEEAQDAVATRDAGKAAAAAKDVASDVARRGAAAAQDAANWAAPKAVDAVERAVDASKGAAQSVVAKGQAVASKVVPDRVASAAGAAVDQAKDAAAKFTAPEVREAAGRVQDLAGEAAEHLRKSDVAGAGTRTIDAAREVASMLTPPIISDTLKHVAGVSKDAAQKMSGPVSDAAHQVSDVGKEAMHNMAPPKVASTLSHVARATRETLESITPPIVTQTVKQAGAVAREALGIPDKTDKKEAADKNKDEKQMADKDDKHKEKQMADKHDKNKDEKVMTDKFRDNKEEKQMTDKFRDNKEEKQMTDKYAKSDADEAQRLASEIKATGAGRDRYVEHTTADNARGAVTDKLDSKDKPRMSASTVKSRTASEDIEDTRLANERFAASLHEASRDDYYKHVGAMSQTAEQFAETSAPTSSESMFSVGRGSVSSAGQWAREAPRDAAKTAGELLEDEMHTLDDTAGERSSVTAEPLGFPQRNGTTVGSMIGDLKYRKM